MDTHAASHIAHRLNRFCPTGLAGRRHREIQMMAVSERRERAADILADGLVRLLKQRTEDPATEAQHHVTAQVPHLALVPDPTKGGGGE